MLAPFPERVVKIFSKNMGKLILRKSMWLLIFLIKIFAKLFSKFLGLMLINFEIEVTFLL